MAFTHGSKAKVYVGGRDLTGFLTSAGAAADRDMAEASTLGMTDKAFIPGLIGGTIPIEGLFAGSDDELDEIMEAALADTAGRVVTYMPAGDTFGARGRYGKAHAAAYEISTPVDGVAAVTGEFQMTNGPDGGKALHPLGAETASADGTSQDDGAASANGGVGYLQVTDYATITSIIVKVQHSVNTSVWLDLITFTTVTAANQSERIAAAGTVNQYVRASWTIAGSGSAKFHVGFARK